MNKDLSGFHLGVNAVVQFVQTMCPLSLPKRQDAVHNRLEQMVAGIVTLDGKLAVLPVCKEVVGIVGLQPHILEITKNHDGEGPFISGTRPAAQDGHTTLRKRREGCSREGWKLSWFAMTTNIRCEVESIAGPDVGKTAESVLVRGLAVAGPTTIFVPSTAEREGFPSGAELMQKIAYRVKVIFGIHEADGGDACQASER